jgi:predicted CXXCH cytochrome family protein
MKKAIGIPILTALFSLGLSLAYGAPAAEEGCVTAQCHAGMLKARNIHPGAKPCQSCHQTIEASHPQKKKKTFKLTEEIPGLCYQCHPRYGALKHIHPPVKDGMCSTCHNPHDSAEPKLLAQPARDLCASCHPDKIDFGYVHGPVAAGDCMSCHEPHESNTGRLLVKGGADLCYQCHVDLQQEFKKKFVHPAIKGGCTACHDPHGSAVKKFFTAGGAELCYQCHPQVGDKLKASKSIHPPIKTDRSCASCHAPHASDAPKLLPKSGKDLCLDCHKDFLKKAQTVLHGPINDGKCTPCHDPHGTPNDKLLVKPYSSEFYVSYTDTEFQLCFSCHNRDLLKYPTTSFATGFRDGDKNLHYIHVNRKDRGKRCKVCHVVHAGENPKLIADKVPFGKWNLPLKFVKTETGGSCAPGCHQAYPYDRKTPGKEMKPAQAPGTEKKKGR